MRQSSMFSGIIYLFLGILFTYFAIQDVQTGGWGIFTILLAILAAFDCGKGIKLILFSILIRKSNM